MDYRRIAAFVSLVAGVLPLVGCGGTAIEGQDLAAPRPDLTKVVLPDMVMPADLFGVCAADRDCTGPSGSCCNSRCTSLLDDARNCGRCGNACPDGSACCVGKCANTASDPMNCGACGTACQVHHARAACSQGTCSVGSCDTGFADCNVAANDGCETETVTNLAHCGACGVACMAPHAAGVCSQGMCGLGSCHPGYADCNGNPADGCEVATGADPNHCGGCDILCLSRPNAVPVCKAGDCVIQSCMAGYLDCDMNAGNGCEVLGKSNALHCGACGMKCGQGQQCVNSACTCLPCALRNARSSCQNLMCVIDTCFNGFGDCDGVAMNGCEVTFKSDNANCGSCGVKCDGQTPYCLNGACAGIGVSCAAILAGNAQAKSGLYVIDPDGNGGIAPYPVHCDMTTAGGGWTMVLNLDTSDGNVMWWGNAAWEDNSEVGEVLQAFDGDHKSLAWNNYSATTEVLLVVHEQGTYRGWKRFRKVDGRTMLQYFADNKDNTLMGTQVLSQDIAGVGFAGERLVRLSSALYVNHCVVNGGSCTTGSAGSPDGDRIGSHEGTPSDNTGGGLGNWHDMRYCCGQWGTLASGKVCNVANASFRTTSEAQAGWAQCYSGATSGGFGTDSFAPWTFTCNDNNMCNGANWAGPSNVNYDYSIFLR